MNIQDRRSDSIHPGRVHLPFLDGIRGLAALTVLISHLYGQTLKSASLGHYVVPGLYEKLRFLTWGRDAVGLFIVLSGFSLTLPLALSGGQMLPQGIRKYFSRRAWRILPAYYATCITATVFTIASHNLKANFVLSGSRNAAGAGWAKNISPGSLLSHLVLVHNWSPNWVFSIEPALWSVAVEWQIYLFLPFVLLPIWRKAGIVATVAIAFIIGYLPHILLPSESNFDWSAPWYLGLFSLGMAGAFVAFSAGFAKLRKRVRWGLASLLSAVGTYGIVGVILHQREHPYVMDFGIGITAMLFLVYCCVSPTGGNRPPALEFCSSKSVVWLGTFSYSLYLTRGLVITRIATVFASRHIDNYVFLPAIWATGLGLSVTFAYLFSLLFEKPFLTMRLSSGTKMILGHS